MPAYIFKRLLLILPTLLGVLLLSFSVVQFVPGGSAEQYMAQAQKVASIASNWPYPSSHAYGASKAFVAQFSHNLRCDLADKSVRVTSLEPRLAESELSLVRFKGDAERASHSTPAHTPFKAKTSPISPGGWQTSPRI